MAVPRQLEMVRPNLDALPELRVPEGCGLRTYLPGDEAHWARIMNDCIGAGWTVARCREELVQRPEFRAGGWYFATVDRAPQATATAWQKRDDEETLGYVHMVGVARECRGRGLGELVTLATLHWFRDHGFRRAMLHTDDWRVPAIGLYLKLGFEPVVFDEHHARRWAEVRTKLAARGSG
jgi:mycothiol synthase